MTALKEALSRAINEWESDDTANTLTSTTPAPAAQQDTAMKTPTPTNTTAPVLNTEIVFNMIRAHGSMTGVEVRDELERRGYKWASDASSYLNQMANRGLLSRARENTADGHATNRFACLFPEYHRTVKSKKARAKAKAKAKTIKPTKPVVVAPTPVPQKQPVSPAVAPTATNNKTQAQAMVAEMNIGLAREVYLELHRVFNLGA